MDSTWNCKKEEQLCFFLIIGIYLAACWACFPYFYQIIDPDDTAYLTIADHYAIGDFQRAINGMWSPLNSWLGALFYFTKIPPIFLFKYINIGIGVIGYLATFNLIKKFSIKPPYRILTLLILLPFWVSCTYGELCADWLQTILILIYLSILYSSKYKYNLLYPLLCGILGALAFYAKYYNFHFFWLHFTISNLFIFYNWENKKWNPLITKYLLIGIGTLVACALPWVLLLHQKYGFWGLNYTGKIDISWNLDYTYFNENYKLFIPPSPANAPSYWEDPIWIQKYYVSPFTSFKFFGIQLLRIMSSFESFIQSLNEFSALCLTIWSLTLYRFLNGGYKNQNSLSHAAILFFTLPAGYFLFHFEGRFIWELCIFAAILGVYYLQTHLFPKIKSTVLKIGLLVVFSITFITKPESELFRYIQRDDEAYKIGCCVQQMKLKGTFATNLVDQNKLMRVAYLSKGLQYLVYNNHITDGALGLSEINRFQVKYYFQFHEGRNILAQNYLDQFPEILQGKIAGLKIYQLR